MTLRSPETAMVSGLLLFYPHGRGSWVSNTFLTPARQQGGHFIGNGLLARYIQVAVDVGRHLDITVAQPLLHVLEGEAVTQQETGAAMPLRYNYDKPEKPRISRVFGYLARFFILFQTEKSSREVVIS